MRILHLIDPSAPGGGACTLRLLATACAQLKDIGHDVILIGSGEAEVLARRCGVPIAGRIAAPLGEPALVRRALRRVIHERERVFGRVDVLHGWTLGSALLAGMAAPDRPRLATLAVGPVTGIPTRAQLLLLNQYPAKLLAVSPAVADEYRAIGVPSSFLKVLPPGIDVAPVESETRRAVRERWEVDDGTFVVGALAHPIEWSDARQAIDLVGRAALARRPVRVVLHPRVARRADAAQWASRIGLVQNMVFEAELDAPWRVRAGLDAALMIRDDLNTTDVRASGSLVGLIFGGGRRVRPVPGLLPALWAMGAGVPVITEDVPVMRDVVVDGATGCLVSSRDVNEVTERILCLQDDRTAAERLGAAARELVADRFGVDAFASRLDTTYREAAGGVVEFVSGKAG